MPDHSIGPQNQPIKQTLNLALSPKNRVPQPKEPSNLSREVTVAFILSLKRQEHIQEKIQLNFALTDKDKRKT